MHLCRKWRHFEILQNMICFFVDPATITGTYVNRKYLPAMRDTLAVGVDKNDLVESEL